MLFSEWIKRPLSGIVASLSVTLSFLIFAGLFWITGAEGITLHYYDWISFDKIQVPFSLYLDPLSLLMCLIITGVGAMIHFYSIGYMDHEKDHARYFACLNFFIFAILLLVLASHLLLLFVGWEGVGVASYLLIGFWNEKESAERAAFKAFIVNRVGDLSLLLAILLTLTFYGTDEMIQLKAASPWITVLALLLFLGASAKSAQIPLQSWLPDAMEGPTPVSALIHAATMVTAGVYLVVRLHALFLLAPEALYVVGLIGGVTALYAALCAVGQTDLKRVLAYSTISQLGLMFLACGAGAFYAAMLHLTMHAFVKALLFLSAGNVLHMLHGETEMTKMGGLKERMPKTHLLFLIGILALSGIPPFAAFFSKELILDLEFVERNALFYILGFAASVLTAFYLMRAYCFTFLGRGKETTNIEAPPVMLYPLYVLGLLSILGGFLGASIYGIPLLESYLESLDNPLEQTVSKELLFSSSTWIATFAALIGLTGAYWLYKDKECRSIAFLKQGMGVDAFYDAALVHPFSSIGGFIAQWFEPKAVMGSLALIVKSVGWGSREVQLLQNGQIRTYAAWMAGGAALLLLYLRTFHA